MDQQVDGMLDGNRNGKVPSNRSKWRVICIFRETKDPEEQARASRRRKAVSSKLLFEVVSGDMIAETLVWPNFLTTPFKTISGRTADGRYLHY